MYSGLNLLLFKITIKLIWDKVCLSFDCYVYLEYYEYLFKERYKFVFMITDIISSSYLLKKRYHV